MNGIYKAIEDRQQTRYNREALVTGLQQQYAGLPQHENLSKNLELLWQPNTFTITTAHQPNIFTGPVFSIYKIFHAIKMAEELQQQMPANNFIPVFFMGSEDADIDELNNVTIEGKKYVWLTEQTGSVGRMKTEKNIQQLIAEMDGQLSVLPYGSELIDLFKNAYAAGKTIQQASLEVINILFGGYGLVVLIPDSMIFKQVFKHIIQKELKEQFSHKAVSETIEKLGEHYKVQAPGREINLFYLQDDKRERIEKDDTGFFVDALNKRWTEETILAEADEHPEMFSPNVILRGMMQEVLLPNLAYIGGGGELAYWLELKGVFAAAGVPYPMLMLRNSFMWVEQKWKDKTDKLELGIKDLFTNEHKLMKQIVQKQSDNQVLLNGHLKKAEEVYNEISEKAAAVDATLNGHVMALKTKAMKDLVELEKKMVRAEKKKFEVEQLQLQKIKSVLFPDDNLQERVENFSAFYARYGKEWMNIIYENSQAFGAEFGIIVY